LIRFNGKKSKEIWDFEIFDKASRGAWGSVLLLFRTKGRSLAALGAILTLLLIANDTFFQQLITYPERWSMVGQGSITRVVRYQNGIAIPTQGGIALTTQDINMKPSLDRILFGNGT
jgi:hypothetical protein